MVDFSVVIPALNLRDSLELVLRCLEAQSFPKERFECIIVDDGSTDSTRSFLQEYNGPLRVTPVFHNISKGRGAARNAGWKRAAGAMVVFLDGDTLPSPGWLAAYSQALSSGRNDVLFGERYCIPIDPKGQALSNGLSQLAQSPPLRLFKEDVDRQFDEIHRHACAGPYRAPLWEQFESELREVCSSWPASVLCAYTVMGSNVAVRRELLESVKGFDQFLRRTEDTDLGIRLWEAGTRFTFAAGARAYHQYDEAQPDRGFDLRESLSFFYRNPYEVVLLVFLWFSQYSTVEKHASCPPPGSLVSLVRQSSGRFDANTGDRAREIASFLETLADCRYTAEELVEYFCETYPIPRELMVDFLRVALDQGLYTRRCGAATYFDFHLTSNWLRLRTPFGEQLLRRASYIRTHKTKHLEDRERAPCCSLKYVGRYEISVESEALRKVPLVAVENIPLPVESLAQQDIRFLDCWPRELLPYLGSRQMVSHFPWNAGISDVRLAYEFECTVRELSGPLKTSESDDPKQLMKYLQPSWPAKFLPKLKHILKRAGVTVNQDQLSAAKLIYLWVLNNIATHTSPFPHSSILETGLGACISTTKLFVALCRLALIPARECCCSAFTNEVQWHGRTALETKETRFSPFNHTWAMCHIAERGWMPVDFMGRDFGKRILTPLNVPDLQLRSELLLESDLYDDYYFGNLDPYRIHAGSQVNDSPIEFKWANNCEVPLQSRDDAIKHRLTCRIVERREG